MIRKIWIELRSSLWFVPSVLVLLALGLALGFVEIDIRYHGTLQYQAWQPLLGAGAEGARGMLTAIAGSMITVVGVVFSVTIVTLSLASTQYTPRILRNFMRDRANQFVLGIFVAIYTYCLIVLRTIRAGNESGGFVPLVAVTFGLLLALTSIFCLIFFIHHIASSIQASQILREIAHETTEAMSVLFPEPLGDEEREPVADLRDVSRWHAIPARESGYLQHMNAAALGELASQHKTMVSLRTQPGDFVTKGTALVTTENRQEEKDYGDWQSCFVVGAFRTVEQDVGFGIRQIVDIAMKALSPGVNDTSTAASSLDYLGVILCQLAGRRMPQPKRGDGEGLQVLERPTFFGNFLSSSLDEIRLCAAGNVTILMRMIEILRLVAEVTKSADRRDSILLHARLIVELADHSVAASHDRERINRSLDSIRSILSVSARKLPKLQATRTVGPWN